MLSSQVLVFFIVALAVVATGVAVLLSRNAVYSVLFLVANFASVAVLYMTLGAPFIALAQVTVYAGAIMVLFLFVVMLLGAERLPGNEPLRGQRLIAGVVFVALLVEAGMVVVLQSSARLASLTPPTGNFASPTDIGMALFTQYSLPFELTSVLLVVAAVGAIVLTHRQKITNKPLSEISPTLPLSTPMDVPRVGVGVREDAKPAASPSPASSEVERGQGGEGI